MNSDGKLKLRKFLKEALEKHGDQGELNDSESLFVSGRLDSFSMMQLVMQLEEAFGLDFSTVDFDVSLIDSLDEIAAFVDANAECLSPGLAGAAKKIDDGPLSA
jgi:acyl carrier protein